MRVTKDYFDQKISASTRKGKGSSTRKGKGSSTGQQGGASSTVPSVVATKLRPPSSFKCLLPALYKSDSGEVPGSYQRLFDACIGEGGDLKELASLFVAALPPGSRTKSSENSTSTLFGNLSSQCGSTFERLLQDNKAVHVVLLDDLGEWPSLRMMPFCSQSLTKSLLRCRDTRKSCDGTLHNRSL